MITLVLMQVLATEQPIYLGVLETSANPAVCAYSDPAIVRVAFQFVNGRWAAVKAGEFPASVSWVLALDGKRVGEVQSHPDDFSCKIGAQRLIAPAKVPQFTANAKAFSNWLGVPPFRPLVALSAPNYTDPDQWKPFQPTSQQFLALHGVFRKEIPMSLRCDSEPAHDYPVSYIRPIAKGYRSKSGKMLIGLIADPGQSACMNWPSTAWFFVDGGQASMIRMDIKLLDSGDYDGDGSSELLFHLSEDNHDGYLLFRPRDRSKAVFSWKYH